ncbi:MAG TPA: hypothetical protein VGK19_12370 [Capsulimonadaceae bacterium]|jgi:alpha-galactosidase/6-phospho-beta-glucosidase family protein
MKVTYIGGGAYRVLPILRGAMSDPRLFDGGEICLYDLAPERTATMAAMLERTPEFAKNNVKITHGLSLEASLTGADAVGVIFPAGSWKSAALGTEICLKHGYISSDNVSPNGAMHGLKAGPTLLSIARSMEKYCPNAWLLDFVNPVAVFSGMVNNHTKIKALGVCAGYTNHQWDISRLLGADRQLTNVKVEAAGINHLAFITKGDLDGEDIFKLIDKSLAAGWKMPPMHHRWHEGAVKNITQSVTTLAKVYQDLGVLIFSTEGDGMQHLFYDEAVRASQAAFVKPSIQEIDESAASHRARRIADDRAFAAHLNENLDQAFWDKADADGTMFERVHDDIFIKIMRGIAGLEPAEIVSSRTNQGAIKGIDDRNVVEYSQTLFKQEIKPRGNLYIPGVVQGMITGLAAHQTLLGDAIATEDPKLLAHALQSYPWMPYSKASKSMFRELLISNAPEITPAALAATEYLV